jgi:hypothetical protein
MAPRSYVAVVVGFVAVVLAGSGDAGAAVAKKCAGACTLSQRRCITAAKAERKRLFAACTGGPAGARGCRAAATRARGATVKACRALRKGCATCCRARKATCDQPAVTLDAARAVRGAITADGGGRVTVTAANGVTYTLDVPPGALLDDETVTLTPVTAIGGFAVGGGLLAAVHAEPSGLLFLKPATLTIGLPAAPGGPLVGFGYDGPGVDFHTELLTAAGATARILVTHFSGFGAGAASSPEVRAILARPSSSASQQFADQFLALANQGVRDRQPYLDLVRRWYRTVIRPALQNGVGDDGRLRQALRDYDQWLLVLQTGPLVFGLGFSLSLPAEQAEALSLIAAAIRDAVARADARCLARHSLADAETALEWQVIAGEADVGTPGNALDIDTVLGGLCLEAQYDAISYPPDPPLGQASELDLVVGLVFIDGVPATGDRMLVDIVPHGTVELTVPGDTNPDGSFAIDFTPQGDRELRLDVHSCGDVPGRRRLKQVCQDAFVIRGLDVEPSQVTVGRGASQEFTATLFGRPAPMVSWSTTGGTIDQTGDFTAGDTPGTFEVRATNAVDGRSGTATVVIPGTTTTVTSSTTTTLPGSFLGDWQGHMDISGGGGNPTVCPANEPNCARLTVQTAGNDLRVWFCNHIETICTGAAINQQCSLQFAAMSTVNGFNGTGDNNNPPCCIGCPGQQRVYGCTITATFSVDPNGQQTLEGSLGGSVTFCPSDPSAGATTHFKLCRPDPCPVLP